MVELAEGVGRLIYSQVLSKKPRGQDTPEVKGSPQSRNHLNRWRKRCVLIHPSDLHSESIKSLSSHRGGKPFTPWGLVLPLEGSHCILG